MTGASVAYAPSPAVAGSLVSPRQFGGVGDGIHDDTAAIQAAIDYAIGGNTAAGVSSARAPKHGLTLDGGLAGLNRWLITAPLTIYSVDGFVVAGDGMGCQIRVSGSLTNALDVNGSTRSTFQDFTVVGNTASDTVNTAVSLDWDPAKAARSSSGNRFLRVLVKQLKYQVGFGFGNNSANRQVDNNRCWDCSAEGQWTSGENTWWQSGFKSGSGTFGNILGHQFYACSAASNAYNFHNWAVSSFNVYGGSAGSALSDIYIQGFGGSGVSVRGLRTELSQRLLITTASGSQAAVTLSDILFDSPNVPGDKQVIQWGGGGALILDNVVISGQTASPIYYMNGNATKVASIIIRGGATTTAGASLVVSQGASAPFVAMLDGYETTTAGQVSATATRLVYTQSATLAASLT